MLFLILFLFHAISSYSVNPESYDFFPTKSNHLPSEDVEIIKFSDNKPIFYFNDLYSRQYRLIFSKNQSDWSFTLFFEDLIPSNEAYAIFVIDFFGEKSMKFEVIFMEEPAIVNDDLADPIKRKLIKLVINNENWAVFDVTKNSDFPKEFTFTVQKMGYLVNIILKIIETIFHYSKV
uniref:Uncharacterized protein n=1 Tax=Panagrolaimus superbus TaxID=310955 RepID=A0A914Y6R9_9BILA